MPLRKLTKEEAVTAFWTHVQKGEECWVWIGSIAKRTGYGRMRYHGTLWPAHRWIEWVLNGDIPPKIDVAHTCDNKPCVRPDHLYRATRSQNVKDAVERGQLPVRRGEHHWNAKLSSVIVQEMRQRRAAGEFVYRFYREYNVTYSTAKRAVAGTKWQCVQP